MRVSLSKEEDEYPLGTLEHPTCQSRLQAGLQQRFD